MVSLLVGNKDIAETNILCQKLANDKDYRVDNVNTGEDTINPKNIYCVRK